MKEYEWCLYDNNNAKKLEIRDGLLIYTPSLFDQTDSDYYLNHFLTNDLGDWRVIDWRSISEEEFVHTHFQNVRWQHDKIKIYGKEVFLPRFSAWYGDSDAHYSYSGINLTPLPWDEALLAIKQKVEALANTTFNSVLLNWYRDGDDYIGWHSDNEQGLGCNPVIASVNFGATRRFQLRRIDNHNEKIEVPLSHGTALIMAGATQHFWQHGVPKQKTIRQARVNLTFRSIVE